MDRVRFGRALGRGARAAARTAVEAAQAAAASSPTPRQPAGNGRAAADGDAGVRRAAASRATGRLPMGAYAGPAARAAWGFAGPLLKVSRALWQEVTGSFFALFALSFAGGVWHTRRSAVSAAAGDRYRFYAFCALSLVFAYFSMSNFLRARRSQGRALRE